MAATGTESREGQFSLGPNLGPYLVISGENERQPETLDGDLSQAKTLENPAGFAVFKGEKETPEKMGATGLESVFGGVGVVLARGVVRIATARFHCICDRIRMGLEFERRWLGIANLTADFRQICLDTWATG